MSEADRMRVTAAELGSKNPAKEGSGWRWLPVALALIALDQLVKAWMVANLKAYEPHHLLPVLDITLMYNPGAAFSFLAEASGWQRWAFIGLSVVVSLGILVWLRTLRSRSHAMLAASLSLILGGAIGNVIDRIRMGHVVDFVFPHWNNHYFPAFNVADSAITVGAVLLALDALLEARASKRIVK
jgi:signal peptidase II